MSEVLPNKALMARALELFRAITHEDRLMVLVALGRSEGVDDSGVSVGELAELCGSEQSAMSHHLRRLRDAGLVRTSRRGKQVFYALRDRHVARIIEDALEHVAEARPSRRKRAES
ncbi:MAG: helix-turn-helix transcriptional regulator [Deltaproteobacteria bacterium]|nr:helix-turn-helix transcriptional regulator [Deltaproteobacteria bacterium]